jgi:sulfate/thiosulfate transport system substrate-binding protein
MTTGLLKSLLASAAALALFAGPAHADGPTTLTLVGYSVAKPVFAKIIPAFKKEYRAKTGQEVAFKESYGGSGAQTRSILGGLQADVLATNVQAYVDPLVAAGLVKADWASRTPNGSSPATTVVVAMVRPGNPKNIKDWADFARPGVEVVALNPKTSGNARWSLLGGYAALDKPDDHTAAEAYVRGLVKNTKTLASGGREATDAFVRNRIGDVQLNFENEAKFANKAGGEKVDYVTPETNIRVDFPVVAIDKNIDAHGTRAAAEAFVQFLFSEPAQTIYAEAGYRPFDEKVRAKFAGEYAKVTKLLTIADAGGWAEADRKLFADGALYDQAQGGK